MTNQSFKKFVVFAAVLLYTTLSFGQLAKCKGKFLGNIMPSSWGSGNSVIRSDYADYWNQVTPENAGKWGVVEGTRDVYNWTDLDEMYNYCQTNGYPFKLHVLVWGSQQPDWMNGLSQAEQREELEEWYALLAQRYPNTEMIDVVNESIRNHAPDLYFKDAIGGNNDGANNAYLAANSAQYGPYGTGWDFIIWSFAKAREYFPNSELHLNDYGIINDPTAIVEHLEIVNILKDRGLIDAVGIQCHQFNVDNLSAANIQNNLDQLATAGLPIYVAELDITGSSEQEQKDRYEEKFPVFWEHPSVAGITLWGYVEGTTWIDDTGILNADGTERAAMTWLKSYMASQPDVCNSSADTMYVSGTNLYSSCGEKIVMRGVNEMFTWLGSDKTGATTLPEIAKTGANAVRLVWTTDQPASDFRALIENCIANKMIAVPELHDATGDFSKLQTLLDYWKQADVVQLMQDNKKWVVLNIGNEVGDGSETNAQFQAYYEDAITQLRNAGYTMPIMIDAGSWGNNENYVTSTGSALMNHDPLHNLIFSVHTYWIGTEAANQTRLDNLISNMKGQNLPLCFGEAPQYAASPSACTTVFPYAYFLQRCQEEDLGWLAWSWGAVDNNDCNAPSSVFDITSNGVYGNWTDSFGEEICVTDPNSIKNTSVVPVSLATGNCSGNTNPTITLSSPQENTQVIEGNDAVLNATTSDSDGNVVSVEFFKGNSSLGTDNSNPFSYTVSNLTEGTYTFTAVAKDDQDGTTTSEAITIEVISCTALTTNGDILCESGTASLSVSGGVAPYKWFTTSDGTSEAHTGSTYEPSITSTTTYYVEDATATEVATSASFGETDNSAGNGTWGIDDFETNDKKIEITVTSTVTIEAIHVFPVNNGTNVTLRIMDGTSEVASSTVSNLSTGKQRIPFNVELSPGTYILDAVGTSNQLTYQNEGATFPYSYQNVISFTGTESWVLSNGRYGMFYDWEIKVVSQKAKNCPRTEVTATLDPNSLTCDADNDGTPDSQDACPNDPNKAASAGTCGCGVADTDSDNDGVPDCNDVCANGDDNIDTDNDNIPDACDNFIDVDDDGISSDNDCNDNNPNIGVATIWYADTDNDGLGDPNQSQTACEAPANYVAQAGDNCPSDVNKTNPGTCGCGTSELDSDNDGTPDCVDQCPNDNTKTTPGSCGCGVAEGTCVDCMGVPNGAATLDECGTCIGGTSTNTSADSDNDGVLDCQDNCVGDNSIDIDQDDIPDACDDFIDQDKDGVAQEDDCDDNNNSIGAGTTWYADSDNDGAGDPNTTLISCDQPQGYVSTSDDNCPNDVNKTVPGNCGCGNTEGSCEDCNGIPNGSAYLDDCQTCVGGSTGLTPCGDDCAGVAGGSAYIDQCGVCVEGTTGLVANATCTDCNGDINGTAFIDDCDVCVDGNTGKGACVTAIEKPSTTIYHLYPNPFTNQLTITHEGSFDIVIRDVHGRVISTVYSGKKAVVIETTNWVPGVYFVVITTSENSFIEKASKL